MTRLKNGTGFQDVSSDVEQLKKYVNLTTGHLSCTRLSVHNDEGDDLIVFGTQPNGEKFDAKSGALRPVGHGSSGIIQLLDVCKEGKGEEKTIPTKVVEIKAMGDEGSIFLYNRYDKGHRMRMHAKEIGGNIYCYSPIGELNKIVVQLGQKGPGVGRVVINEKDLPEPDTIQLKPPKQLK
ncbi:MAG: hypothetical protein EXS05_01635 [Planctomycetaceae bacterium]|nr:hypothetical protein [Planctomycetaceae bacterium]